MNEKGSSEKINPKQTNLPMYKVFARYLNDCFESRFMQCSYLMRQFLSKFKRGIILEIIELKFAADMRIDTVCPSFLLNESSGS